MKISKILNVAYWAIMILLFVWMVLSWGEIIRYNCHPDPVYHAWNLF